MTALLDSPFRGKGDESSFEPSRPGGDWPALDSRREAKVKDARSEAQKEIEDYRKEKESEYQKFEKEVCWWT